MAAAVAAGGKNTQQQKTPATDAGCRCFVVYQKIFLRAVDAVAGIAQAGNDVAVLVQVVVLSAQIDVNIGVSLVQGLNAFRSSDQTDELDALCAVLLDLGNGINGAAAGCQHGIQNQNITLGDILGQLAEVFHGLQGLLVAVQADKADLCSGQQGQHTVQHTHACTQDGHQSQLAACQHLGLCHGDGGLDLDLLHGQVTGGLVAQQGCDLADQITELLGTGLLVAQDAQLVLQQGMLNDHRGHKYTLLFMFIGFRLPSVLQCAFRGGRPQTGCSGTDPPAGRQGRGRQRGRPCTGRWHRCGGGCTRS